MTSLNMFFDFFFLHIFKLKNKNTVLKNIFKHINIILLFLKIDENNFYLLFKNYSLFYFIFKNIFQRITIKQ